MKTIFTFAALLAGLFAAIVFVEKTEPKQEQPAIEKQEVTITPIPTRYWDRTPQAPS